MSEKINLAQKLATFTDHWSPRTVAQLNDYDVMVVKVKGEFVWHKHDETDDFFLVLQGTLDIELRDRTITLRPGEMYVVPKGVEHRPVAREEVHLLLIEPTGTPNTGISAPPPRARRSSVTSGALSCDRSQPPHGQSYGHGFPRCSHAQAGFTNTSSGTASMVSTHHHPNHWSSQPITG